MFIAFPILNYSTRMKKKVASATVQDPLITVKGIVRDTGEVTEELGGFLIKVKDRKNFPWADICRYLLSLNHDVWMEMREGELYIVTSPKAD